MSQRQQLERIYEIDRQIREGLYPKAEDIMEALGCSRRVVFNDREFMVNRLHAPIEYDRERGGWYYTNPDFTLPNIMVEEGELLAFLLSIEIAERHFGTALENSLRSAIDKIATRIKGPIAVDMEKLRSRYTVAKPTTSDINEAVLLDFYRAAQNQHPIRMNYYTNSRGEWNERTINPHHLYQENGAWYVFGFDHLRQGMRNFHLGRIDRWEVLDETFEVELDFSAEEWMANSFDGIRGEKPEYVEIWFDAYQARWIRERRWPDGYEIEELPDGELLLRFQTGGLDGVKRWVMQYGSQAELREPRSLREEIVQELRLSLERYEEK